MKANRRGISLIQLLIVMSVMSVITTVSTFTLLQMFRIESLSSRNFTQHLGRMRLAEEFRRDVHAATAVEIAEGASGRVSTLSLTRYDGGRIVYEGREGQVTRTATTPDGPRQHDAFALGRGIVKFSRVSDWAGVELAHMQTVRPIPEKPTIVRTWRVRAQLFQAQLFQAQLGRATGLDERTTAAASTVAEALP